MATEAIVPDLGLEQVETSEQSQQSSEQSQTDPKQADREYSQWIKSLREDGEASKFHRRLKDDFGRLQELKRIDPKGIDGIRSRYSEFENIAHGEKKGIEAVQAMQSSLAEMQSTLEAITSGDPAALDGLPEEQQEGIMRLAPAVLDRLMEFSPEAYSAALLPHFVGALRESELASAFNQMASVLQEKMPSYLTEQQKGAWTEEKFGRIMQQATTMSQWFRAQEERLKNLGQESRQPNDRQEAPAPTAGVTNPQHWEHSIYPQTNQIAEEAFTRELKPWMDKLAKAGFRLSEAKKEALAKEFVQSVAGSAMKNQDYRAQMKRYNSQKSPDAGSVISLFRSEFNKHANSAMKSLITRDYDQVLNKPTKSQPRQNSPVKPQPAPQPGVKIVSVRPSRDRIDFQRTPTDWIYSNRWRLKDGSVVQYRP